MGDCLPADADNNCILPDEAVRRAHAPHATEGARARNSQVKELIVDGTLESCCGGTEEAISAQLGESFRLWNRARQCRRALFFRGEENI